MAKPVGFEGANFVFTAPPTMTPDECGDLEVFRNGNQIVSCWRLSEDELERVAETGVVWLSIVGAGMPPVNIQATGALEINGRDPVAEPYIKPAPRKGIAE